jgi:hypothetical protein
MYVCIYNGTFKTIIYHKNNVNYGVICLLIDGIISFEPKLSLIKELKMEFFHENIEKYKSLTKDGRKPFLTDNRAKIDYTSEQKQFMKEQLPNYFTKVAVVIHGDINMFIFNSFMYLYKPTIPIKSFVTVDSAIEWLNKI